MTNEFSRQNGKNGLASAPSSHGDVHRDDSALGFGEQVSRSAVLESESRGSGQFRSDGRGLAAVAVDEGGQRVDACAMAHQDVTHAENADLAAPQPIPESCDVLVVGLGPGGAAAASMAASAGLKVVAIERNRRFGEPVQCAEFIPLPMGAYARAEGVLLQRIDSMRSVLPSGAVEHSDFPGLMIDRAVFDRALMHQAVRAGALLYASHPLVGLDSATNCAEIQTAGGRRVIRYRRLIAADGPHSPVATALGLPSLETVATRQYTVALRRPYTATDIWLSDDYPGGYAWLFPKGNLANLGLGADKRLQPNLKQPLEALHRSLIDAGLLGADIVARTGGAIPVGGIRQRIFYEDAVFVGDAAGLCHPITGAGIAAAVVSGEAAGRAVVAHLAGDAEALDDYDEDMRDQFDAALSRAVARRRELGQHWRTPTASHDATHRRGWIAFPEYFVSEAA